MVDKEKLGRMLKEAARIIPGIGSYQDKESIREADKGLRTSIARRLEDHLGAIEWLKVSQAKKGAYRRMDELEALSRHLEKAARAVDSASRGYAPLFSEHPVDEALLKRLFEHDQGLWELVSILDSAVQSLTADEAVPKGEDIEHLRNLLRSIEKEIRDREQVLKS